MKAKDTEAVIKAEARDWVLRLSLESPSPGDRAEFASWCAKDSRHVAAYRRFESIWQDAASLRYLESLSDTDLPMARDPWWRRGLVGLMVHPLRWTVCAGLAVAIIGVALWYLQSPDYYATGIAQIRDIRLPDGSEVTLGARSSLEVAFHLHERHVALTSGVAYFSVSKNAARPFVVQVGSRQVRVLGTKFEIRCDPDGMRVSVVEGTVEVMNVPSRALKTEQETSFSIQLVAKATKPMTATIPRGAALAPSLPTPAENGEQILTAGQQVTVAPDGALPVPQAMPREEPAAWRHGRLVYVDTPLKDIVADANRYSREPISIADGALADVRLSVTYPSNRITEMVSALSRSLSLEIEHPVAGGIVLKPKETNE